jgi:nitroreductase
MESGGVCQPARGAREIAQSAGGGTLGAVVLQRPAVAFSRGDKGQPRGTKDNPAEFDRMLACLVEKNQEWAKGAPVLMISVARLRFRERDKENRHAQHDVGLAAENLVIQAMDLDLFVHQMAGFDREKARETYGIPDGYEPVAAIAIGYMGDADGLPEHLRKRQEAARSRRPLSEFVFAGEWGKTAPVVRDA